MKQFEEFYLINQISFYQLHKHYDQLNSFIIIILSPLFDAPITLPHNQEGDEKQCLKNGKFLWI